jgi:hypothetical protein
MPMRFIAMVKADERSEAGVMADEKMLSAMGKYNEQLIKAGLMLGGDGLHASAKGARVKVRGKKFSAFDGPFAEAKELVGGYWLLQANTKQDVVDWMKKVPFRDGEIEIRQLYEVDDFPKDPGEQAGNWRDQETSAREQSGAPAPVAPRKPGTTRWILLLKGDKKSEAGELPTEAGMNAMAALMDDMGKAGAMLGGEGLKPSALGAKIKFTDGKRSVIDGPFTETKELIAGYLVLQTATREEAVEWAKRWLQVHVDFVPGTEESEIEIRRVQELEDYPVNPAEKPGGWRDKEAEWQANQGNKPPGE